MHAWAAEAYRPSRGQRGTVHQLQSSGIWDYIRHHSSLRHFGVVLDQCNNCIICKSFQNDNILLSIVSDKDHLRNVRSIKAFYRNLLQYIARFPDLGYRVSKESISSMDDKLDAITNKPPPKECVIAKVASEIFYEIWVRFFKRAASATHCQIVE